MPDFQSSNSNSKVYSQSHANISASDDMPIVSRFPIWVVLLALALGSFGIGITEFVAMSLLPQTAVGLSVSLPEAGYAISAYALGVVVGAPVLAVCFANWAQKPLLLGAMVYFTLGNLLSACVNGLPSLLVMRFLTGLPHGLYLGVAALVAARLVPFSLRSRAVALTMAGLAVATLVGVPVATYFGQSYGWRMGFLLAAAIGGLTVLALWVCLPNLPKPKPKNVLSELALFSSGQVWLTMAFASIGFGGMFAVYSYAAAIVTHHTQVSEVFVPIVLAVWGVGMVVGGFLGGFCADHAMRLTLRLLPFFVAGAFLLFIALSGTPLGLLFSVFWVGVAGFAMGPVLQTRLMDVAGEAQTLGAALNHTAFNIANALGAWLGGLVLALGLGWLAPAWVGVGLSFIASVIIFISLAK